MERFSARHLRTVFVCCLFTSLLLLAGCGSNSTPASSAASDGTFPAVSNTSYDFGTHLVGSSVTQSVVTLSNPTGVSFVLGDAVTGDGSFAVSATGGTCGASLASKASCTLAVTFLPQAGITSSAALNATLQITFRNLRTTFTQSVALTGTPLVFLPGTVASTANPQVALYTVNMPAAGTAAIQFGPTTAYGLKTWTRTATAAGPLSFFVAGMLPNSTYHMQAIVQLTDGSTANDVDQTFAVGAPEFQPNITASTTSGMTPQPGVEQLSVSDGTYFSLAVTDLSGRILWSYAIPGPKGSLALEGAKLLPNGDFLVDLDQGSAAPLTSASDPNIVAIREIDLAGNTVRNITTGELSAKLQTAGYDLTLLQFHHDVLPLANGHWIVLANILRTFQDLTGLPGATNVLGDVVIDLDPNGNPVWVWNSFDHLDVNRHPLQFPDWTHSNALVYTADDGNLLLSMRHQNWVLKLDYANGKGSGNVLWRLGEGGDFKLLNGTDPTDWSYAQHFPSFASKSTAGVFSLIMMDNGDDRAFPAGVVCNTPGNPPCLYTTIPIYQLDEAAKTASLTFHNILPTGGYSFFGGNAEVLANGDLEYDLAGLPNAVSGVFEILPTSNTQVVWQMHTGSYAYRAYRIPSLYPGVQW